MKRKRIKWILAVFVFAVITELILSNTVIGVTRVTVSSERIPSEFDGYRILFLADLHDKEFGDDQSYLLRKIKRQDPDIVLLGGDMINSWDETEDFEAFYALARGLAESYPVYYIVGNHEEQRSDETQNEMFAYLESLGIHVLDNEKVELTRDGASIALYGLWFNLRYYKNVNEETTSDIYFGSEQITQLLGEVSEDRYTILLTHNPVYFDTYAAWGADLTLAGHLHGGMIRIPFFGGVLSPSVELFPEYDAGVYEIGSSELFVTRGLGNGAFYFRFLNHPEIAVITLESE
jgi:predicted MPP superfamily phosphohydrolase